MATAGGGEAPGADSLDGGVAEGAANGQRRRKGAGSKDGQEAMDELAVETKRTTLLDRLEIQLKGRPHVSRLLFGFNVAEDKKVQKAVDQEFMNWRQQQEGKAAALSGLLLFAGQGAIHFLEGPSELIFKALEFFHSISAEAQTTPEGLAAGAAKEPEKAKEKVLISTVRVLHFTELHGVRSLNSWCSIVHTGKAIGGNQTQLEDGNCPELVFVVYKKLLCLCLKVKRQEPEDASKAFKKAMDDLPNVDEIVTLLGKSGLDYFFSFEEFEKVFIAPFQLVLHSELLWPMAPALSY